MRKWLIAFLTLAAMCGCSSASTNKEVQFHFPDGFTGAFVLVKSADGIALTDNHGICRIDVPDSRLVLISTTQPLHEMRKRRAFYASGIEIPVYEVPDDKVGLRSNGLNSRDGRPARHEFFVGTQVEMRNFDFSKWNPEESQR